MSNPNTNVAALLAAKAAAAAAGTTTTTATPPAAPVETFQMFTCSRAANRLITPKGFRISFTGGKYVTQNAEAIAYLEQCIKDRVPGIAYSGEVTSDELNPEAALRKKHIAEYLAEQEAMRAPNRDMGTTLAHATISPASTESQPKA